MSANRRDFIKFVVAGAVTAGCPIDLSLVAAQTEDAPKAHPADVDGEDNRICHQVRDKGSNFFTRPPATERHDVVIIGGGVSGLTETSTLFIFRSLDDRNYTAAYATSLLLACITFIIFIMMEFFRREVMTHDGTAEPA